MLRKALRHQLKLIKSSWRELQPDDYDAGTVIRVRMPGAHVIEYLMMFPAVHSISSGH